MLTVNNDIENHLISGQIGQITLFKPIFVKFDNANVGR